MVAIKAPLVGRKTRFRTPTQEELEEIRDRLAPFFDDTGPLSPPLDTGPEELTPFSPPAQPEPEPPIEPFEPGAAPPWLRDQPLNRLLRAIAIRGLPEKLRTKVSTPEEEESLAEEAARMLNPNDPLAVLGGLAPYAGPALQLGPKVGGPALRAAQTAGEIGLEAMGQPVRRLGTQIAKEVVPEARRLLEEEAGFAKLPPKGELPKEPWEMYVYEFFEATTGRPLDNSDFTTGLFAPVSREHSRLILDALEHGKPVPEKVLRGDYPYFIGLTPEKIRAARQAEIAPENEWMREAFAKGARERDAAEVLLRAQEEAERQTPLRRFQRGEISKEDFLGTLQEAEIARGQGEIGLQEDIPASLQHQPGAPMPEGARFGVYDTLENRVIFLDEIQAELQPGLDEAMREKVRYGDHEAVAELLQAFKGREAAYSEMPRVSYRPETNIFEIRYDVDRFLRRAGDLSTKSYNDTLNATIKALQNFDSTRGISIPERGDFIPAKAAREAEIARGQGTLPGIEAPAEAVQPARLTSAEIREATDLGIPLQPPGNEEAMRTAIREGKERGFARTVRTADITPGVIKAELTQHPRLYDPITNADTVKEAQELIDTDLGKATRLILDSDDAPDALTTVTGELLATRLIRSTDTAQQDEGLRILDKLFERATTGGQGIQAFSIYGRLTPEGNLLYVQRIVKQAQKQFPGVKLTQEKAQEFLQRAEALQAMDEGREKVLASAKLLRDELQLLPRSVLSKLALTQTMAQLLNPKTAVRNIFGNLLFWPAENLSRLVALGYDIPVSMITGKRSVVAPNIGLQIRAAGRGTMEAIEEVGRDLNLRNLPTQFDLTTGKGFQRMGPQLKGVPVLGGLERALSYELRVPDRAFFEAAFDDGLWNWAQVTAKNEGGDAMALFAKPSKEGIEAAYLEGLYRTFQDESVAAVAFSGIKRALNLGQDFGLGDLILKYPRTPGNLLMRGLAYTPFGFFQALFDVAQKGFRGKAFNQQAFVETLGRATVGTVGLTVPGVYLASLGILTGRGPRDKDVRALQRESGERPYTLNLSAFKRLVFSGFNADMAKRREGDKLITYDWALPLSLPIAMTAELGTPQPKKLGKREAPSLLADLSDNVFAHMGAAGLDALATGIDAMVARPMMQGLQKLFGSEHLADNLVAILASLPSSFTPSVLNQVQQLLDNTMKETWRPEKWEEALTTVLARVPLLAAALPDRLNVWGEPADRYQNDTNNPWNVFVNPAFIGEYLPRPEAEMVLALHEATGQTTQFPRVAPRTLTVGGRQYELTPEQVVEYQGLLGQATRKAFGELAQSDSFRKADPEEQVKFLARVLNELNLNAKLTLHERYSAISGAINPIPEIKDEQGAFGKYVGQSASQVWNDTETLKPYEALREDLLKRIPVYANAVEKYKEAEARQDVVEMMRWKNPYNAFNTLLSKQREAMRNRDKEIFDAGVRLGKWNPRLSAPAGTTQAPSRKVGQGIKVGSR